MGFGSRGYNRAPSHVRCRMRPLRGSWQESDVSERLRRLMGLWVAIALVLAAACGIDDDDDGDSLPSPSGSWVGSFINEDGAVFPVTSLFVIETQDGLFRFDFDVDALSGGLNAVGAGLASSFEAFSPIGEVDSDRTIFFAADEGLALNGRIAADGDRIRGNWSLDPEDSAVEGAGTWSVVRN